MNRTIALRGALAALAAALILAPTAWGQLGGSSGPSNAANKTAAAGSTVEVLSPAAASTVLATTIKTSAPQDLIFAVTLECALWTTVATVGNDDSTSQAKVVIQVLFDGQPVAVSGAGDDGKVVFCDRVHRQATTQFDDEDATLEQYLATRSANAFNWILPDAGNGVHTVEVKAEFVATSTDGLFTQAGVGHRTLVVEPTHLAQGFRL